jgi:hypothetical protein
MKNLKQYYKELGKMVYAVAMADGMVSPQEKETLHHFVVKKLVNYENSEDSSGMNNAFYVDFEFDDEVETHADSSGALKAFAKFVHENYEEGDEELMRHSLEVLERVAVAYTRKKEQEIVNEVKNEIKEVYKEI